MMTAGKPGKQAQVTRTADELTEQELGDLAIRLLEYVRFRGRTQFGALGFRGDDLAFGTACQDVVNLAMASLFEPRGWDPEKHPDPFRHLISVANSNLVNMKSKYLRRIDEGEDFAAPADAEQATGKLAPTADDFVALRDLHDAIETALLEAGDADLIKLYDLARCERHDPAIVAEELKISVREADNLKKRLRRLVSKAVDVLESEPEKGRDDER